VIVGADALRQMAEGLYSPVQAYLDGKMKLGGDVALGKRVILNLDHSGSQVDACSVPSSQLVRWNGYPTIQPFNQFSHWLILKCTYSDDRTARDLPTPTALNPAITDLDTLIDLFLSLGGIGTGNLLDYYRDVSYGAIDIETTIMGWYDAPFAEGTGLSRYERIQEAANAVPDSAGIDFGAYDGIVLVMNKSKDGGAWGVGKQAINIKGNDYQLGLVVFDPNAMYTAFACQEVGHGLGLNHSTDSTDPTVDYRDPFDMMSTLSGPAGLARQFGTPNYPAEGAESGPNLGAGPGMNIPNLLTLGVLPSDRLAVFEVGSEVTDFTIAALSHPEVSAPLGIKIVNPAVPDDFITIEYREPSGWDKGFEANTVLIHEDKVGSRLYSILQRHDPFGDGLDTGMWLEGYLWETDNDPFRNLARVVKIDPVSHTATISVNSLSD
jgi:hypothetical protein